MHPKQRGFWCIIGRAESATETARPSCRDDGVCEQQMPVNTLPLHVAVGVAG